ncbi:MAG: hypothetical protein JW867_03845 [Candidatus Omnitrophica bacterium]|nr:hypothetical protein [Candidatus Omnitrophota bacterium]
MSLKFSTSDDNALIIRNSKNRSAVKGLGRFKPGKDNNLDFVFSEASNWQAVYDFPKKITFKGKWRLNSNHDLVFDVQEKKTKTYSLVLKGTILDVRKNFLIFQIKSKTKTGEEIFYPLMLKGSWKADKYNRIIFNIEKDASLDRLVFKGSWDVNKEQKIEYSYSKTKLKTKTKTLYRLTFNGYWDFSEANRLKFIISRDQSSYFDFKAFIGSKNIYPKKGELKFRLGIGTGKSKKNKVVTFYGDWRLQDKKGLSFEVDLGSRGISSISFYFDIRAKTKDSIVLQLKDLENKPLAAVITYKRKMLRKKDLEYFLRLEKNPDHYRYDLGVTLRF